MLNHLNLLLRKLFEKQLQLKVGQIGFEPPDQDWRTYVDGLDPKIALNLYLVDLRENHGLRSNEQVRTIQNGSVTETPAPRWVDCHYLITAWDRATPAIAQGVEPTLVEHGILYGVMSTLLSIETQLYKDGKPLTPRHVYEPDPLPSDFPAALADANLPTSILPGEGFPKLAEFWGTMGTGYRWKPVVYLVVTLPVVMLQETIHSMVTALVTRYGQTPKEIPEVLIEIGGSVLDTQNPLPNGDPSPVVKAEVRLETPAGELLQTTKTDEQGHFTLAGLQAGTYQLHVQAEGLGEKTRAVDVYADPHGTGLILYDVQF
jgi:hypothetical protein